MITSIPDPVVKRLPMYYRYLKELENEGISFISSVELGKRMDLNASQIRQDANAFGGEGRQGYGYPVPAMRRHLEKLLGIDQQRTMIIVGAGNMGAALLHYRFDCIGFSVIGAFDSNPQKTGEPIGSAQVQSADDMEAFLESNHVDIAVLTVPARTAQETAERIYRCGVRGFWNFAPVNLQLPRDVSIVDVHLDDSLELLSYWLSHPAEW